MLDEKKEVQIAVNPYASLFKAKDSKRPSFFKRKDIEKLPPISKNVLIQTRNLTKSFGKNLVLESINIGIPEGKIFGIIGLNGSGKTTLLKLIIGFYRPTKGDILFNGQNVLNNLAIRREIGFASQDNCFYDDLTVEENVRYFGKLYGLTEEYIKQHIFDILSFVKLDYVRDRLATNLSTGMKRRLDLACALIHDPKLLILDEPTEDLDPSLRKEMLDLIRKINKKGTTVLMTSHMLWEVEVLCDIIMILHDKKVLGIGKVDDLRGKYAREEEIHLTLDSSKYDYIIKKLGKGDIRVIKQDKKIIIFTSNAKKILPKLLKIIGKDKIIELNLKQPDLQEIFEKLTRK